MNLLLSFTISITCRISHFEITIWIIYVKIKIIDTKLLLVLLKHNLSF